MILMMARRRAGPRESWPKTLKAELENNSRMPRDLDLVKNRHSDSLKMGLITLGDVAGDDNEGGERNSVSIEQVTAALCAKELFLRARYI